MNMLRKNSEIAFCLASPEIVKKSIYDYTWETDKSNRLYCDYKEMNANYYHLLFRKLGTGFSQEEMHNLFLEMKQHTQALPGIPQSLFQLLVLYAEKTLRIRNGIPLCRRESILGWRATSLRLGQDIFTTALFAYKKAICSLSGNVRFDYPALINTDDFTLEALLNKGIAENHFHLAGSTRQFPLSWLYLMNNPYKISEFFDSKKSLFNINRSQQIILSDNETLMPWREKMLYAVWLRANLFRLINGLNKTSLIYDFMNLNCSPGDNSDLYNTVTSLKLLYGVRFLQPNDKMVCLDYAIKKDNPNFDIDSYNRLLWGERELMFECFYKAFTV